MQEIAPEIYIETAYAGVTLGAINWPRGLVLIDSPFRPEDARSWKSGLLNLGGGVDRLLINLDAHFDRTLGSRAMDITVVGNEKLAQAFRNRPVTFKTQAAETGAEWEQYNGLGSIRWASPEITFTEQMQIHWNNSPLVLESHPGPAVGAIWAVVPESQVIFLGDAVTPNQPPFLAAANLSAWIAALNTLLEERYQNYLFVSGRGGLVTHADVRAQLKFLETVKGLLEGLAAQNAAQDAAAALAGGLLAGFNPPAARQHQYQQRLIWGLRQYYLRHYQQVEADELDE
jgi:glyoxylase-like metal-dependent hydrolase (beta-lactamase superfamily II)